jgi:hypothetical protein
MSRLERNCCRPLHSAIVSYAIDCENLDLLTRLYPSNSDAAVRSEDIYHICRTGNVRMFEWAALYQKRRGLLPCGMELHMIFKDDPKLLK